MLAVAALAAVAVALAACGGGATPQPTATVTVTPSTSASPAVSPSPTRGTSSAATTRRAVYLLRPIGGAQPVHAPFVATARRAVPQTVAVATAAVNALLAGPTARERAIGMSTDIPAGTTLRRLTIAGGVATVDLSSAFTAAGTKSAMTARLAQVVYTLTQFPSVGKGVLFKIDGAAVTSFGATGIDLAHPQRRADYESVTPPIFVDEPGSLRHGERHAARVGHGRRLRGHVPGPVGRGRAAQDAHRDGDLGQRHERHLRLQCRAACRQHDGGKLTVWDASAENGAALHTVTIPLIVR